MSYLEVTIGLLIFYLLGPTSLWANLPISSLIFSGPIVQVKIEVSSLAPEHVIKAGEFWFLIGLPVDCKSPIGRLRSNQTNQLSLIE
jgi:hypothetical protein